MGRSKPITQSSPKIITDISPQKIDKLIQKQEKSTISNPAKLNAVQMDLPGGRRRLGRAPKVPTPEPDSSSSPVDADSSNEANGAGGGSECRRSSRKKTIKFDVRDLLNKNRKGHKIQIEARIDSNAPKQGAGQASREELDSKQKTFIEKSAIFRRFSISENKLPPRPPPPPVALIQSLQQCVGELEQLPRDGDIDTISPIARRLSRTQEILSASMMKPKQVSSLIVTTLESASTSRATPPNRGKIGRPKMSQKTAVSTPTTQKRRGRPPKCKAMVESSDSVTESSNDSFGTNGTNETSEINTQPSESSSRSSTSVQEEDKPEESGISTTSEGCISNASEGCVSNGREVSVSPDSSTKGIDLKEMLDASAVTLPQPRILDDCMLASNDDLFVAAEEEVFTAALSSDESTGFPQNSPKENNVDEISLFARSDSIETNSSDDSEHRRKKVRVSVKRVAIPSPIKERLESTSKGSSSEEKSEVIEIFSSNDDSSGSQELKFKSMKQKADVAEEVNKNWKDQEDANQDSSISISTRAGHKKKDKQSPIVCANILEGDNSNSTTIGSIVEISSDAATPVEEILGGNGKAKSPPMRVTPTRRAKSNKRSDNVKPEAEPETGNAVDREQSVKTHSQNLSVKQKDVPANLSPKKGQTDNKKLPAQEDTSLQSKTDKNRKNASEKPVSVQQIQIRTVVSANQKETLNDSDHHPGETSVPMKQKGTLDDRQTAAETEEPPKEKGVIEAAAPQQSLKSAQLSLRSRKDAREKVESPTSTIVLSRNRKSAQQEVVSSQISSVKPRLSSKLRKNVQEAIQKKQPSTFKCHKDDQPNVSQSSHTNSSVGRDYLSLPIEKSASVSSSIDAQNNLPQLSQKLQPSSNIDGQADLPQSTQPSVSALSKKGRHANIDQLSQTIASESSSKDGQAILLQSSQTPASVSSDKDGQIKLHTSQPSVSVSSKKDEQTNFLLSSKTIGSGPPNKNEQPESSQTSASLSCTIPMVRTDSGEACSSKENAFDTGISLKIQKDTSETTTISLQNQISNKIQGNAPQESICSQQSPISLRRVRNAKQETSPKKKDIQEQIMASLQSPAATPRMRLILHEHSKTTGKSEDENEDLSDLPSQKMKPLSMQKESKTLELDEKSSEVNNKPKLTPLNSQNEEPTPKAVEKSSDVTKDRTEENRKQQNIPLDIQNEKTIPKAVEEFSEMTKDSDDTLPVTHNNESDEKSSTRKPKNVRTKIDIPNLGRRESLRAAIQASTSATKKSTPKTLIKAVTVIDQTSSSSESSEYQQGKPRKGRRQVKATAVNKSKEETSSVCSESSSISSSSSSSSSSSTSSSSFTSSSPSSASSSSSSTSSSSSLSLKSKGRATRSKKAQQSSTSEESTETKEASESPSRKLLSSSESTESEYKTSTTKKSCKPEKQFNEPDSESSENSAKLVLQKTKSEKTLDNLCKERAKLIQRRKSIRLNRWASVVEEETNETGSESSETPPSLIRRTRSGRSKSKLDVSVKSGESDDTNLQKSMLTQEGLKPEESIDDCSKPLPTNIVKDKDEPIFAIQKAGDNAVAVASIRSKSKRRARKTVPLKGNSSDSTTLSDDETSSNGNSPFKRLPPNTRARRKTISSSKELKELLIEGLSPPYGNVSPTKLKIEATRELPSAKPKKGELDCNQEEGRTLIMHQKNRFDSKPEIHDDSRPGIVSIVENAEKPMKQQEEVKKLEDNDLITDDLKTSDSVKPSGKNTSTEIIKSKERSKQTISRQKNETKLSSGSSDNLMNKEEANVPQQKKGTDGEADVPLKVERTIEIPKSSKAEKSEDLDGEEPIMKRSSRDINTFKTTDVLKTEESVKAPSADKKDEDNKKELNNSTIIVKTTEKSCSKLISKEAIGTFEENIKKPMDPSQAITNSPKHELVIEKESQKPAEPTLTTQSQNIPAEELKIKPSSVSITKTNSIDDEDRQKAADTKFSSDFIINPEAFAEKDVKKFAEPKLSSMSAGKPISAAEKDIKISTPNIEATEELIPTAEVGDSGNSSVENAPNKPSLMTTTPVGEDPNKLELERTITDITKESTALKNPEENVCPLKTQKKKEISPRKKKKDGAQQQEPSKCTEIGRKFKKKNSNGANKELDSKPTSSESNQSDDSLKAETSKSDSKPTPRRQLDSSFIESLEKSLLRPTSAKKASKKKEKEAITTSSPKEKEESRKSKKAQEILREEQKKPDSCSPKLKKKQKEASKLERKPDEDTSTKRKITTKASESESLKPLGPNPSKSESSSDLSNENSCEVAFVKSGNATQHQEPLKASEESRKFETVQQQITEVPICFPKTLKSKAETKFYPDELLNQERLASLVEPQTVPAVAKEKSPDLLPDPLKDIEKFIEDGVNLLKRGYKLEDDDETALDRDILKSDDLMTPKKCKLDDITEEKKESPPEDDNSNSNSECSSLATTPSTDIDAPNGIRRSHRIKNNSKSSKCLVGRGLVRDRERFSTKDDEKTIYSIDDQKMDLAEVEAKNSKFLKDMEERLSNFRVIRENEYKCERVISKEAKRMICDCFLTPEEEERGELGCGEDCLNRLLMIECGHDCTVRDRCTNRRFTKFLYSPCRVFRTEKKGFGIMADIEILPGEFIMEYVGEVINGDEFEYRRNVYSQDKNKHYYFMALRSDAIIDATAKGNISRFINHSCDPNAETQKWTVNGELRIGFFSRKNIMPGEEITFDYQYQRYGKEAQKCYCESSNCRGWIGEEPSSEEEELDEESEETEEEEEEEQPVVALPEIPAPIPTPFTVDEQLVPAVPGAISPINKDIEIPIGVEVISSVSVPAQIPAVALVKVPKEVQIKKKKEKKRLLEWKEEKIKRRETKQFLEDPDIEDEVRFLVKCGLKNQADTLRLSRLIVRAKLLETRLKLLQILRKGELPCRRLFLDYHGLRLLHGWMSEVFDTRDTEKNMEIRMVLLSVLECLPIPNKTMLTDSKVYQTVRDWSNNKESHSPSDESPKETTSAPSSSPAGSEDSSNELQKLAAKLITTWDNLPEVFRIPKRERIEQMKEHEREADRQYKGLGEDVSQSDSSRNRERFMRNNGPNSSRFKWSRSDKDKERERTVDRRKYAQNVGSGKDGTDKTAGDSQLSKEQRRELFAAKVARDEAEKRLAEERREFDIKCRFFGLDPKRIRPENMPFCVNPSTGQWYSTDKKPISTPPSYAHVQVPVKPKSTNPEDYQLPPMDLPPLWKFAISPKGKIYYYHVKIRIPQWEPPIKILPLAGQNNAPLKNSESDSSNAEGIDSSEDDIEVIKGLDPVKLQAYIEKKIENRRLQRYNRLVEEKPISPRKEEDRIYNQMEVRKYKENKEKIRKRKEEIRRRRESVAKGAPIESNSSEATTEGDENVVDALPIQDYLLSSDEEDIINAECNNSPLIDKIVQGDKIVDELDALQCKRPFKRPLPIREKYEHKKRKLDKSKDSNKSTKRSKDGESSSSSSSSKYRKIKEKFRCEIAGIIVQHLKPYRKETCASGRILSDDDFNHLARKLTHFVMVKELKYCESIGQTLVVTESVKNKSREFIKKYMAKYGGIYVRPKNDPEFKEIPFL